MTLKNKLPLNHRNSWLHLHKEHLNTEIKVLISDFQDIEVGQYEWNIKFYVFDAATIFI